MLGGQSLKDLGVVSELTLGFSPRPVPEQRGRTGTRELS